MNRIKSYRNATRLVLGAAIAANFLALPLASQAAVYFYTDLNPSGPGAYSLGWGISGSQQVGEGGGHALLWSGTYDVPSEAQARERPSEGAGR